MYNLSNTEAQFKDFLVSGNISAVSVRNYMSDLRYFHGWYVQVAKYTLLEEISNISLNEYRSFLIDSQLPITTINRRLSTLRKYVVFLLHSNILLNIDVEALKNVSDNHDTVTLSSILLDFKTYLLKSIEDETIVEGYLNDIAEADNVITTQLNVIK